MEESKTIIGIMGFLGSIASITSLLIAYIQTKNLKKVKERRNKDIWMAISGIGTLVDSISSVPYGDAGMDRYRELFHSQTLGIYRSLLKEASIDEKEFTSDTIVKWYEGGKIKKWEIPEASRFLDTGNITNKLESMIQ